MEKRIARLTWNTNGWVQPSGKIGKSTNKDSHEGQYGYGHEEWLFDNSKVVEGYRYGFLEPIRKQQQAYVGKNYNVWLYSIDGISKKRYFIGEIRNVEVISEDEADRIKDIYVYNGWFDEMETQIKSCGANNDGFSNWQGVDLFNIRFKISDIDYRGDYFELPKENMLYGYPRYTFAHFKEEMELSSKKRDFKFISHPSVDDIEDDSEWPDLKGTYEREPKTIEVEYLHRIISKKLQKILASKYGAENVTAELPAGYGNNKIDMVVRNSDEYIFYEIKTYNSSRTSVREALGQLIEYSCWTDKSYAHKLVIVMQSLADNKEVEAYIRHLRKCFNIPLYLMSYDVKSDNFSDIT